MRVQAPNRVSPLRRREGDLAHAVHMHTSQALGHLGALGSFRIAQALQRSRETLVAGYLGSVALAFDANLFYDLMINMKEALQIEPRAQQLLQGRHDPRDRAVRRMFAPGHKRKPLRPP